MAAGTVHRAAPPRDASDELSCTTMLFVVDADEAGAKSTPSAGVSARFSAGGAPGTALPGAGSEP